LPFGVAGAFPDADHPPADPLLIDRPHDRRGVRAVMVFGAAVQVAGVAGVVLRLPVRSARVADRLVKMD
jgi:hypothetical protein